MPRCTGTAHAARPNPLRQPDEALLADIRAVLATAPFLDEGYREVWPRLRARGVRTSKARCLRLIHQAGVPAPGRAHRVLGPRHHDGTTITDAPDVVWDTDATRTRTAQEERATVFTAIEHATAERVDIDAALVGTRFEAREPTRQGVKARFGAYSQRLATGLTTRHDSGSKYISEAF
ncbi:hypothetical protein [Myxococcus sp. Y35]|uniref:hypothetical protein n=1 Tax=Pseudomyxococcus flavus TaxID=3115648 RepID=UPI003CF030BF